MNIRSVFPVRRSETTAVILAFLYSFFLGIPQLFSASAAGALFLANYNASDLPSIYVITGFVVAVIGIVLMYLQSRYTSRSVLRGVLAFLILGIGALFAVLRITEDGPFASVSLLVWVEIEYVLTELAFWVYANELFTIRQAKRLFGIIGVGQVLAAVVGGALVPVVVGLGDTRSLLLVSLGGVVIAAILFVLLSRNVIQEDTTLSDVHRSVGDRGANPGRPSEVERSQGFRSTVRTLIGSPYVRLIFAVVILEMFAAYLLDVVFYHGIEQRFTDTEAIATFLAVFLGAAGLVKIFVRSFLSSRWLDRFGVPGGIIAPAIGLGVPAIVIAVLLVTGIGSAEMLFVIVALARLIETVLVSSIYAPAFFSLFQPLPKTIRSTAQNVTDTVVGQFAAIGAGVFLLLMIDHLHASFGVLAMCLVAVLVLWAIVARRMGFAYGKQVGQTLEKRGLGGRAVPVSLDDVDFLLERAANGSPGEADYARAKLKEVSNSGSDLRGETEIDFENHIGEIDVLERQSGPDTDLRLIGIAAADDARVRSSALFALHRRRYHIKPEHQEAIDRLKYRELADAADIRRIYAAMSALSAGFDTYDPVLIDLLYAAVRHEYRKNGERIFLLLGMSYPRRDIATIRENLFQPVSGQRDFAVEYADTLLERGDRRRFVAYLDVSADHPVVIDGVTRVSVAGASIGSNSESGPVDTIEKIFGYFPGDLARDSWLGSLVELLSRVGDGETSDPLVFERIVGRVVALRNTEIFAAIPDEDLAELAEEMDELSFPPDVEIIAKGEAGSEAYLLTEGTVIAHDGDVVFAEIGAGNIFGELSALSPEVRSASITTTELSVALRVTGEALYSFLNGHIRGGREILAVLARRIRDRVAHIRGVVVSDDASRVAPGPSVTGPDRPLPFVDSSASERSLLESVMVLRSLEIFRTTPESILTEVAARATTCVIKKGDPVPLVNPSTGDPALVFILYGSVVYQIQEYCIIIRNEGDVIDGIAPFDREELLGRALAEVESQVLLIPYETVQELVWDQVPIVYFLLMESIGLIRELNRVR